MGGRSNIVILQRQYKNSLLGLNLPEIIGFGYRIIGIEGLERRDMVTERGT